LTDCVQRGYASYNFIEILLSIHDYLANTFKFIENKFKNI